MARFANFNSRLCASRAKKYVETIYTLSFIAHCDNGQSKGNPGVGRAKNMKMVTAKILLIGKER
jgi:hypothetical protein